MIIKDSKIITTEEKHKNDLQLQTTKTVNLLSEIRTELQSSKVLTKEQIEASSNSVNKASELLQEVIKQGFSEQSKGSKATNELLNNQLDELSANIISLKEELIVAISEKDISETKFAKDINKNFTSVIDLLKLIKDKKTTVIGGGGGSNLPLVTSTTTGNYSVPVVNPDGSSTGNTLGIPIHNNGTVTYPNAKTDVFTFKKDATTVAVVTIGYTDSTKSAMSSWSIA